MDITWRLIWDLKEYFERGFRMDIVLEVSEIEDYSEFPNIEIQNCGNNFQEQASCTT